MATQAGQWPHNSLGRPSELRCRSCSKAATALLLCGANTERWRLLDTPPFMGDIRLGSAELGCCKVANKGKYESGRVGGVTGARD